MISRHNRRHPTLRRDGHSYQIAVFHPPLHHRGGNWPDGLRAVVVQQRQVVESAGRDGCDVGQPGGWVGLAEIVQAPTLHRAVRLERQTMVVARRDGHDVAQPGGCVGLAVIVQTPRDDRAIRLQRQTVVRAGGYGGHI